MKTRNVLAALIAAVLFFVCIPVLGTHTVLANEPPLPNTNDAGIPIDEDHFPDSQFRKYILQKIDVLEPRNVLTMDEIEDTIEIRCICMNISSLQGIEYFTGLQKLYCHNNNLTSLDLSIFDSLVKADCDDNPITEIVIDNPNLTSLSCRNCKLTELDVTRSPHLVNIYCDENELTSVKLGEQPDLLMLWCDHNQLSEVSVYACPYLSAMFKLSTPYEHEVYSSEGRFAYMDIEHLFDPCSDHAVTAVSHYDKKTKFILDEPEHVITLDTDGNGAAFASSNSGLKGTQVKLYAFPDDGYQFKEWQVLSGNVTITENTFVLGYDDVEIKAIFECIPEEPEPDPEPLIPDPDPATVEPQEPQPQEPQPEEPIPVTQDPVFEDFIDRMYRIALLREPEAEGKAFWMNKVLNEGFTGGRCAYGFLIEAPEFLNRSLSNEQFIDTLYQVFFDRNAEADGMAFWLQRISEGMTREQMVNGFIDSTEWCNLCARYGVKSGAPNARAEIASNNALKFAERLYRECLGREPDEGGLMHWGLLLTNLDCSGYDAAYGFFTSYEFKLLNVSDDEFIHRLYRTFMGRDEDADGFAFWKSHLGVDMSREDLVKGFAQSQEFTNICNEYGINKGI